MSKSRVNYQKRFKAIASYVDFSYKPSTLSTKRLTLKQKRKITKYFNEVAALKSRPFKIYKSKSTSKLEAAQKYAGQNTKKFSSLKVAFIPTGSGKTKIKFKGDKIYVSEEHVTTTELLFDTKGLLQDPVSHVEKVISSSKAKSFNIMAGRYEIPAGYNRASLPDAVQRLCQRYGQETLKNGKKNNHYFVNWLYGVRAHEFRKQASFEKYLFDKKKAIDTAKRKRRAQRRKQK